MAFVNELARCLVFFSYGTTAVYCPTNWEKGSQRRNSRGRAR